MRHHCEMDMLMHLHCNTTDREMCKVGKTIMEIKYCDRMVIVSPFTYPKSCIDKSHELRQYVKGIFEQKEKAMSLQLPKTFENTSYIFLQISISNRAL